MTIITNNPSGGTYLSPINPHPARLLRHTDTASVAQTPPPVYRYQEETLQLSPTYASTPGSPLYPHPTLADASRHEVSVALCMSRL